MKDGKGIFTYIGYSTYDGQWKENKKHGVGMFTIIDGHPTRGRWVNDKRLKKDEL